MSQRWRSSSSGRSSTSENHSGARDTEDKQIEETKEGVKGICSRDAFVWDMVMGKGQPSRHAVGEDTNDVYDGIAVQQVSTRDEPGICGMYSISFLATALCSA